MSDIERLRRVVAEIIPFNRALDISITAVSADRVEVRQPEALERLNYVGEAHISSSALFVLAEASIVAMVLHAVHVSHPKPLNGVLASLLLYLLRKCLCKTMFRE